MPGPIKQLKTSGKLRASRITDRHQKQGHTSPGENDVCRVEAFVTGAAPFAGGPPFAM